MTDELLDSRLILSGNLEKDPFQVFFEPVDLTEEQRVKVTEDLARLVKEACDTRGDLDNMLARWNDMAEGIASPKNFPWANSSNLFIPVTEIHLNNVHAAARQTLLKGDQVYYVRSIGIDSDFNTATKLERFINYKSMVELPIIDRLSQLIWCAERDGTAIAQVQWLEDKDKVQEIEIFKTPVELTSKYPTPAELKMTTQQYKAVFDQFSTGEPVTLVVTRRKAIYRGPVISVVQLADFVMAPMTAINTKYASLVGKVFTLPESELRRYETGSGWEDVTKVVESKEDGRKDLGTSVKDEIEGISRRAGKGEFVLVDGIHRFDLDGDGVAERYLVVFHPLTKTILMYLRYPYLHGQDCFVPVRIKKRPCRFLGRGLCQMLEDINAEINTQHNQRIDSRTVTTVPTFKAKNTAKGKFDPTRKDQRFSPGRVFWLDSPDDVVQFDIKPTDFSETLQEESTLMQLADQMTGSSQLRSGKETKQDPRAPAAKVMTLLQQSNVRLDDYFEEIAGNAIDNEGFNAIGEIILSLYHQFFDKDLAKIPLLKPNLLPETDSVGKPQQVELERGDFSIRGKYKVQMAKTSSMQNPDAILLKFMQVYSLLIKEPLVAMRPVGRLNLNRKLLSLAREENPDQYLPKDEQEAAQIMMSVAQAGTEKQQGRGGQARTREGQVRPSVPSGGGSTRPQG